MTEERCEEGVSRGGEYQPCDKPAVAIRRHPEGDYPVCVAHCRVGQMVVLTRSIRWGLSANTLLTEAQWKLIDELEAT